MNDLTKAIDGMNSLPDISLHDSQKLRELSARTAREIKAVGGVSAATSLEMIGYIRELEQSNNALALEAIKAAGRLRLVTGTEELGADASCPKCGERAEWKDCENCGGDGGQYYCSFHRETSPVSPDEIAGRLRYALELILAEPHGCAFCDSGKLRNPNNPAKGHTDECGFDAAHRALNTAEVGAKLADNSNERNQCQNL